MDRSILFVAMGDSFHIQKRMEWLISRGYRVYLLSDRVSQVPGVGTTVVESDKGGALSKILSWRRAARTAIYESRADVVHICYLSLVHLLIAPMAKVPVIATAWGSDIHRLPEGLYGAVYRKTLKHFLRSIHFITAVSQGLLDGIDGIIGRDSGGRVVRYGIDIKAFEAQRSEIPEILPKDQGQFVIFSPRLMDGKYNQIRLIHAVPTLIAACPQTHVIINTTTSSGTDGRAYLQELRRETLRLGLGDHVYFVERASDDLMMRMYRRSQLVVSLPETDGSPLSVFESMASRTPVLAYDIPALRELIEDGVSGYLVPIGDEEALSDTLIRAVLDASGRERIAAHGISIVREIGDFDREMEVWTSYYG